MHKNLIDDALQTDKIKREPPWSQSIAVSEKQFVTEIKKKLGYNALERKTKSLYENVTVNISYEGKEYTAKTIGDGIFYFLANGGENYKLKGFDIKRTDINGNPISYSTMKKDKYYNIITASKGVTNIGSYRWNLLDSHFNVFNYGWHDEIKDSFKKLYPDNDWNNEEWENRKTKLYY